jgi:Concanavalin A-like lectin/glucanases superfamily
LQQAQTYHYRYVATNLNGRANGSDQSFTQPVFPLPGGGPPLRSSAYDGGFTSFAAFDPRPDWDTSVAMTIEAWVYRQDANRFETIVSHDAPGSYWLGFSPRLRFYRGTNFAEVATPVLAYKWTHVAVSYDGALARFYINGELAGIRALNNNGAGKLQELLLGHDDSHNTDIGPRNRFMGNLDEVRLWSMARSEAEIQDGLYREVRGEPGQVAVFPRGGRIEEISGLVGNIGSGVTEQVFGMVPRDLVVPRAAFQPSADGNINFATEYLGAEQLVIRYPDQPDLIDQRAYFVHTSNDLFVAAVVSSILPDSWNVTNSTLSLYIDTTNAKPALAEYPQAELRTPLDGSSRSAWLNGDGGGSYYFCQTPPGIGLPQPCTPRSLYQVGQQFCGGEISTLVCTEFRVSRTLLGNFNEFDGVALGQVNFTSFGDRTFIPEGGFDASPATWLTMSYGDASANLPRVRWSGRVFSGLNTNNTTILPGYRVSLIANSAGYSQFTDIFGRFNFDVPMPTNETMFAQAELEAFGRYTLPRVSPGNVQPIFIGTNRVQFPRLPANVGGLTQLASVDFFVQRPLAAAAIVSSTPTNPAVGMAVRQGGIGGTGEVVTIFGTNLHAEMEFYLAPVSATFPVTPEFWTLLPATILSRDPGGNWVKVHAPFVPEFVREFTPSGVFIPSFTSRWRWVAHDSWFRPGRIEYSYTGTFNLRRPPYPNLYGFSFDNQDHDASLNEFLAGYGYSAYICVDPIGDCDAHIPDPLYWALWYPVHRYVINKSGGSCVGFSGTAAELFNNIIIPQDYDPAALLANGIDGSGFPGHYDTSNTGGRYTRPPIPTDIWGRIRANHGAQTSAEYMIHLLEQLDVGILSPHFGGNPVARLPELRAGTTAQAVCMVQGFDGGHCVAPYSVEGNFGGDPNKTRIWIYDNNNPCAIGAAADDACVTNQFIDIDHSANEYIFPGNGWTGTALFTVPLSLYTGERTAPGLIDFAQALATFLVVVAGGADAHFTTPTGNEWGWRQDGTFVNNLPGLQAVPILGSPTNSTHSIPIFLPHSNGIPSIDMQMRDTNASIFHVAAGGTMLQLESAVSQPGHSNRITLGAVSNQLASFRFMPELAHSNFVPRVGFVVHSNACATFQWMGLNAEGGRALEFRALKSRRAVEFCNETTHSNTYYLRIDAVDGTSSNNACNVFGPFTVPTGAVHCVVLHDWPRTRQVRSELDLNGDGTPDQVTIVTGTEIDSDGDGMPDAWETLHRLDPFDATCDNGPDADPDNDGVSNLGEYLSDTDPHDPTSALRLTATRLPGNKVRLSWKAVPGRRYEIQYANGLEYVFQPLAAAGLPRVATSTEEHFDDTLSAGNPRTRFYRVRLVP